MFRRLLKGKGVFHPKQKEKEKKGSSLMYIKLKKIVDVGRGRRRSSMEEGGITSTGKMGGVREKVHFCAQGKRGENVPLTPMEIACNPRGKGSFNFILLS